MNESGVSGLELRHVVRIGDVHWTEVFGAEPWQALLGNRDSDFFDAVDVGNFGEDLFLVGVEREEGQIFCVEQTEDILVEVQKDLIEIVGRMDLSGNAFDMLCVLNLLL